MRSYSYLLSILHENEHDRSIGCNCVKIVGSVVKKLALAIEL